MKKLLLAMLLPILGACNHDQTHDTPFAVVVNNLYQSCSFKIVVGTEELNSPANSTISMTIRLPVSDVNDPNNSYGYAYPTGPQPLYSHYWQGNVRVSGSCGSAIQWYSFQDDRQNFVTIRPDWNGNPQLGYMLKAPGDSLVP